MADRLSEGFFSEMAKIAKAIPNSDPLNELVDILTKEEDEPERRPIVQGVSVDRVKIKPAKIHIKKTQIDKDQRKSDLIRAAARKRLLLGVKREKGALHLDMMRRILKKNRLSVKPFRGLKKEQRAMRLGLVRQSRSVAKKGYKRR